MHEQAIEFADVSEQGTRVRGSHGTSQLVVEKFPSLELQSRRVPPLRVQRPYEWD